MNETLARLYGTGLDKTASAEDDIDLSQISAADFLAAVENGDIVMNDGEELEKEAGDEELDLENMSPDELVELAQYLDSLEEEEQGGDDGEVLEKMAQSGELEYWDMAGRVLAHSMSDEMSKVASDDDDEYEDEIFGLDELSAEDLMEGIESGELELVELEDDGDFEKGAAGGNAWETIARHITHGARKRKRIGKAGKGSEAWSRLKEMATGHGAASQRAATRLQKEFKGRGVEALSSGGVAKGSEKQKAFKKHFAKRSKQIHRFEKGVGYAKRGVPATAVAGTGAYAYNKKKNRS